MKRYPRILSMLILALLSACAPAPEAAAPTKTLTASPTKAPPIATATVLAPTATIPPTKTNVPASPTPERYPASIQLGDPLPDDGAWLLVRMDYKYYLLSEDGEHRVEITIPDNYDQYSFFSFDPSPDGKTIAFTSSTEGGTRDLYIWALSEVSITHIAQLYNYENWQELTFDKRGDYFLATGSYTWSHDGSMLAFISTHMGTTPDLYVYDLQTDEILWLTSGPALAVNPVWTPDDAYLLHAGVEQLHYGRSGFGYSGWQFFSAAADGSRVFSLSEGMDERGWERFQGWVSDRQMLMDSVEWCGHYDLRMLNIISGEEYFIWRGYYSYIAYSPEAGKALVYYEDYFGEYCQEAVPQFEPGLYLVAIPDGRITQLSTDSLPDGYIYLEIIDGKMPFYIYMELPGHNDIWYTVDAEGNIAPFEGDPSIPEQFRGLGDEIDWIYGWVSAGGL